MNNQKFEKKAPDIGERAGSQKYKKARLKAGFFLSPLTGQEKDRHSVQIREQINFKAQRAEYLGCFS